MAQARADYAKHMVTVAADLRAAEEAKERAELRKMNGQAVLFEFRQPCDVLRKVTPPPFGFDEVLEFPGFVDGYGLTDASALRTLLSNSTGDL